MRSGTDRRHDPGGSGRISSQETAPSSNWWTPSMYSEMTLIRLLPVRWSPSDRPRREGPSCRDSVQHLHLEKPCRWIRNNRQARFFEYSTIQLWRQRYYVFPVLIICYLFSIAQYPRVSLEDVFFRIFFSNPLNNFSLGGGKKVKSIFVSWEEKVPETGYMKNPGTRRIEVWFPDSDY